MNNHSKPWKRRRRLGSERHKLRIALALDRFALAQYHTYDLVKQIMRNQHPQVAGMYKHGSD